MSRLVISAAMLISMAAASTSTAFADTDTDTFQNGFASLKDKLGFDMGLPVGPEVPGEVDGSVIQETTTGLAYWAPGIPPSWTDGFHRDALVNDSLVQWTGDNLQPPKPTLPSTSSVTNALSVPSGGVWDLIASCESHGNWATSTGNGYYGGLQEDMVFWRNHGGLAYASRPDLASRSAQIQVAVNGRDGLIGKVQGYGAWPVCRHAAGV